MNTLTRRTSFDVDAAPEQVFPLLCPVREYDWIADWSCQLLHTKSGVAELDCAFRTYSDREPMTWVVSRYEPPFRVEFTCFVPDLYVMRLQIALAGNEGNGRGPRGDRAEPQESEQEGTATRLRPRRPSRSLTGTN